MPMKTTQRAAMLTHRDTLESSGSDFGFEDGDDHDNEYGADTLYDDEDEDDEDDAFSGSGDEGSSLHSVFTLF